jgi:ribosomal-protein-serine acetyltransferase
MVAGSPASRFELSDGCELRPLEEADADELFALIDRDRAYLSAWLPWAAAQDLEGTRAFIGLTRRQQADNSGATFAIVCDHAVAGVVGLEPLDWVHRSAGIGYWLGERYQGRGVMTRAVSALIEHAVSVLDMNRIEIRVGGAYLDIVVHSPLASEWGLREGPAGGSPR